MTLHHPFRVPGIANPPAPRALSTFVAQTVWVSEGIEKEKAVSFGKPPECGAEPVPSETTFRRSFSAEQVLDLQRKWKRSVRSLWRQGLLPHSGPGKR